MSTFYEAQGIGQFIFQLGFEQHKNFPSSSKGLLNLFQQTSLDPAMTDLFAEIDTRFFMIEFKKEGSEETESKKKSVRALIRKRLMNDDYLPFVSGNHDGITKPHLFKLAVDSDTNLTYRQLSCFCHWLCSFSVVDGQPHSSFLSYLSDVKPVPQTQHPLGHIDSINKFIEEGVFGKYDLPTIGISNKIGLPRTEFEGYLKFLFADTKDQTSDASDTTFYCFAINDKGIGWSSGSTLKDLFPILDHIPMRMVKKSLNSRKAQ